MRYGLQLAAGLLALGLGAAMAGPSLAQRNRPGGGGQHRPAMQPRRADRPPQRQQERRVPQEKRQNEGRANPPGNNANAERPNGNRPPSAYTPPAAQKRFNQLSPQDRQRLLEQNRKFQNLTPAQRQDLQERQRVWNALTPAQQSHVRNDILPKWKQMPVERRQAIRQRLRILQNMPESARNERLSDPNFTRGMSDEDKATLRDLSHMHVGAPDPPGGE